jgi:hypothetical protein
MKILKTTPRPNGVTRLIIELQPGEGIRTVKDGENFATAGQGYKLIRIHPDAHYKLGHPMQDDVIAGHILAAASPVHWCSISQEWEG